MRAQDKYSAASIALYVFGLIATAWLALLAAPYSEGGLLSLLENLKVAFSSPFRIELCEDSLKAVLVLCSVYGLALGLYLSNDTNYRNREEHGSAKWGSPKQIKRKLADKDLTKNKLLTDNVAVSFDSHKHRLNLNVLVCGGSGSGKTRFYAKPNILNANTSFVILDPKGELLRSTGNLLEKKGYEIKVIDLINMEKSLCYNPFVYLQDDNSIQKLATNLMANTTPKGSHSSEPFWDNTASMLLKALICYLFHEAPPDEQNFAMVMDMIRADKVDENNPNVPSVLDLLFGKLRLSKPDHMALRYYDDYKSSAGKTLKSIQITLLSHLEKFNLGSLMRLTQTDELDLAAMGEKKTALYALIPDNDTSFNFIVGMLYTQLFQELEYMAENKYGGELPVPVHFVMDEFANVALPEDFEKELATMRSRGISVSIIIQNIAQLKSLFEKSWENITGNCDEFLYLGGNEQSTHEYVTKLLGKETIDTKTYTQSRGRNGSFSTNRQTTGRDLMTPDEVRMLDNRYALLFIRGERPVKDKKYNLLKHPNIAMTVDGGAEPYIHGRDTGSIAEIRLTPDAGRYEAISDGDKPDFILLSEEELEERFKEKEL